MADDTNDPAGAVQTPTEPVTTSGQPFETAGRTYLRALDGYVFHSDDPDMPVVDAEGLLVTRPQADALIAEAAANRTVLYIDDAKGGE